MEQVGIETYQWAITILVGLLGIASGIGLAHLTILKRVNASLVNQARTEEQIVTLFTNQTDLKTADHQCLRLHEETLKSIGALIQQNTILIERRF